MLLQSRDQEKSLEVSKQVSFFFLMKAGKRAHCCLMCSGCLKCRVSSSADRHLKQLL